MRLGVSAKSRGSLVLSSHRIQTIMMSGRHGIQVVFMLSLPCMATYIMLHLMLWASNKHMTKSCGEGKVLTYRNPVVKQNHWQFAEMQDLESVVLPSPQLLVVCL